MQKIAENTEKILKNISNSKEYGEFICFLKSLSKNENIIDKQRHKAILNTNQEIIGIDMKTIRNIAKIISKNCAEKYLSIASQKTINNSFYEETLIEGLVIAQISDLDLQINKLKEWINKIDNWSTCDSVVCSLKKLKKSKNNMKYFELFKNMALQNSEFVSRFAIVTLMTLYLNKDTLDDIYATILKIKSDKYYINMAIAWLIASGFLVDSIKTYKILSKKKLNKFVQNKAISKCCDSFRVSQDDKNKLKLLRM